VAIEWCRRVGRGQPDHQRPTQGRKGVAGAVLKKLLEGHRLPQRIRAHAQICYLALVLYRVMRMRLKANGSTQSPTSTLRLLARIQTHCGSISAARYTGISRISPEQARLFEELTLPKPVCPPV